MGIRKYVKINEIVAVNREKIGKYSWFMAIFSSGSSSSFSVNWKKGMCFIKLPQQFFKVFFGWEMVGIKSYGLLDDFGNFFYKSGCRHPFNTFHWISKFTPKYTKDFTSYQLFKVTTVKTVLGISQFWQVISELPDLPIKIFISHKQVIQLIGGNFFFSNQLLHMY